MKHKILYSILMLIICFLIFCLYNTHHSHLTRHASVDIEEVMPELTIERAREALIEMMEESDNIYWGSQKRKWTHEELIKVYGNDMFDLSGEDIERIYGNPPPVPEYMNEVTIHYLEDDPGLAIGDWICDLQEKNFCKRQVFGDSLTMSYSSPAYEGEFFLDSSGTWKARYWEVTEPSPEEADEDSDETKSESEGGFELDE